LLQQIIRAERVPGTVPITTWYSTRVVPP